MSDLSKKVEEKVASQDKVFVAVQPESEKSIAQKVADDTQAAVGSAKETVSNLVNTAAEKVQAAAKVVSGSEAKAAPAKTA